MKVLIVDDEPEILNILEEIIKDKFKCEVDKVENGLDAFLLCLENEYNFIVTDYKMPYMTGAALIMALKTRKNLNMKTPCLVLSGFITQELKEKLEIDQIQFMDKPMNIEDLCALLSAHLN